MLTDAGRKALTDWISAKAAGWIPDWEFQDAPAPGSKTMAIKTASFTKIGDDFPTWEGDAPGLVRMNGTREFMLTIQAIGVGALAALGGLETSLDFDTVQEAFRQAGIVFVSSEPIQNLSGLIGAVSMNERGSMDVRFRTESQVTDDVGFVSTVGVSGDYSSSARAPYGPIHKSFSIPR